MLLTLKEAPMSHEELLSTITPEMWQDIRAMVSTWPMPSSTQLEAVASLRPEHRRAYRTMNDDVTRAGGDYAA